MNSPQDTHYDAQIFSPPYLFRGPQPPITSAPASVNYGETFEIGTPQPDQIQTVSLVRLSSVTHSFNAGQRINFLSSQVAGGNLNATAPASADVCPPGHYLLFILNAQGVPSVAEIVQVSAPAAAAPAVAAPEVREAPQAADAPWDAVALQARVRAAATGTRAVVGIQGSCPYGIAACWGGASEALRSLDGVQYVDPVPDGESSTATVYLEDDRLPALDRWHDQFRQLVHDTYALRGVEVTATGTVEARNGVLTLMAEGQRPAVELLPLDPGQKVQWDRIAAAPAQVEPNEAAAYSMLIRSRRMAGATSSLD
jgi:galactose oxidase